MQNTPNYKLNKPEGNDYAKIESLNENADIIDEELKRISKAIGNGSAGNDILSRLDTLEKRVGNLNNLETTEKANLVAAINEVRKSAINAWQKGDYNDTSITNLGNHTAKRCFHINGTEWAGTTNVEICWIRIPVATFSGIIKVTYSSFWNVADASGGAVVVYQVGRYGNNAVQLNSQVIESISPNFAQTYSIRPLNTPEGFIDIGINKAPTGKGFMEITVEIQGIAVNPSKSMFEALEQATLHFADRGSPTADGYPWTPQKSEVDFKQTYVAIDKSTSGGYPDPNTILDSAFITNHANAMSPGESNKFYFIDQIFYGKIGSNHARSQFARSYAGPNADFKSRHYHPNEGWSPWTPSMQQLFQSVSNGKAVVNQAVTDMGIYTAPDAPFATTANNIRLLSTTKKGTGNYFYEGAQTVFRVTGLDFTPKVITFRTRPTTDRFWGSYNADFTTSEFQVTANGASHGNVFSVFYGGFEVRVAHPTVNSGAMFDWFVSK
ncbi:hypothetical protein ABFY48_01850 [Lysinibacillus pakistanensis]|uniref:hypothetical protein n=1 Tax=Lysinibacillus pakistanensis TaxID=759811 RepID=UPI003D2734A9